MVEKCWCDNYDAALQNVEHLLYALYITYDFHVDGLLDDG